MKPIEETALDALTTLLASMSEKVRYKAASKLLDHVYSRYEQERYLVIEEARLAKEERLLVESRKDQS